MVCALFVFGRMCGDAAWGTKEMPHALSEMKITRYVIFADASYGRIQMKKPVTNLVTDFLL